HPFGRVALLARDRTVLVKPPINDRDERVQLRASHRRLPPIARRNRIRHPPSSCEPCRVRCQNAWMPRAGSCPRRKPREPLDIIPRCRSLIPPCATQKKGKSG